MSNSFIKSISESYLAVSSAKLGVGLVLVRGRPGFPKSGFSDARTGCSYEVALDDRIGVHGKSGSASMSVEITSDILVKGWMLEWLDWHMACPDRLALINPASSLVRIMDARKLAARVVEAVSYVPNMDAAKALPLMLKAPGEWRSGRMFQKPSSSCLIIPDNDPGVVIEMEYDASDYEDFGSFRGKCETFVGGAKCEIKLASACDKMIDRAVQRSSEAAPSAPTFVMSDTVEDPPPMFSMTEPPPPVKPEEEKPAEPEPEAKDDFVHLHVHGFFSLLDGVSSPEDLAATAKKIGQPALAITDHGYMHANRKFDMACREHGVKAIHGVEAYFVDDIEDRESRFFNHVIILAQNDAGWANLSRLMTDAGKLGFYFKPRVDLKLMAKYQEGLIVLSGCYKSPVSWRFSLDARDVDRGINTLRAFKEVFGDRFFNEVMRIDWEAYDSIMPEVIDCANSERIRSVATNDVHYALKEQAEVQDVLLGITTGGELDAFGTRCLYLRKREEMLGGYITKEMADATLEIADRVTFDMEKFFGKTNRFPVYDPKSARDYNRFTMDVKELL